MTDVNPKKVYTISDTGTIKEMRVYILKNEQSKISNKSKYSKIKSKNVST